jgi:cyclopropane fatty-acyl-phospholipid synthase-like methyltransferase
MAFPLVVRRRRTVRGVGAYFDLITDDGRLFYGDSFHFGYYQEGTETLDDALDAHTDLVSQLARVSAGAEVLDIGCGIGAPAARIARLNECHVMGVNISREQVREGRRLIDALGLSEQVEIRRGNALALAFPDQSFDAVVCIEVAADICVTEDAKDRLVHEIWRVLRPGGYVGFSDLALTEVPSRRDDKALRAIFYHAGRELVEDWPVRFTTHGFHIIEQYDIHATTMPTWADIEGVYSDRADEVDRRYGKRLADRTRRQLGQVIPMIRDTGIFPALCLQKPMH